MRKVLGLIITLTFLISCSESFKTLDTKKFNEKIAGRTDIKTPEELIKLYYDWPISEGTPLLSIQTDSLSGNSYKITLIHEGLDDDSQSGEKIVMTAKQYGQNWSIIEIKKNWKCWGDRGQKCWGTTQCN